MTRRALAFTLRTLADARWNRRSLGGTGSGPGEGDVPSGIPHLDHVFVIMMENHAYSQIVGNPSAPFMNKYMGIGQRLHELLRDRPSEPDELPRDRRRVELRRPERQQSRLAQRSLHARTSSPARRPTTTRPAADLPDRGQRNGRGDAGLRHHQRDHAAVHHLRDRDRRRACRFRPRRTVGKTIADQLAREGPDLEELPGEPAAHRAPTG